MAATLPTWDLGKLLKDIPPGAWVAISRMSGAVLAYSADMQSAIEQAKAKGEDQPVIIRVPDVQAALLV